MNDDSTVARGQDRRRFLMLMGLACATTALAHPAVALAEPASVAPPVAQGPIPAAATLATATPAPGDDAKPPSAEALAVAQIVRLRYPGALDDAQLALLAQDLDSRLDSGRALRKLNFANGDEPDMTFHA